MKKYLPYIVGIAGSISLFAVYWLIFSVIVGMEGIWTQFIALQPWMSLLLIGFGIQLGLFTYIHQFRAASPGPGTIAATGGISAGSMVACCAHHVTDIFPLLGLTALATFLTQYQTFFLGIGVASNVIGIIMIFRMIQRHKLYHEKGIIKHILTIDMDILFYSVLSISLIGLLGWFGYLIWE